MSRRVVPPRYRRFPFQPSFLWKDGAVWEEKTGNWVPRGTRTVIVGRGREAEDPKNAYYFRADGRPLDDQTERCLHANLRLWLFVQEGRLLPVPQPPPVSEDPKEWEDFFSSHGLDRDAGRPPWERRPQFALKETLHRTGAEDDAEPIAAADLIREDGTRLVAHAKIIPAVNLRAGQPARVAAWHRAPRSAWRKALHARLALAFGLPRTDPQVRRLADFLCRDENWHEWWYDPQLVELYRRYRNEPEVGSLVAALEYVARRRVRLIRDRDTEHWLRYVFSFRGQEFCFAIFRDGKPFRTSKERAANLLEVLLRSGLEQDPRFVAATVWKASSFLKRPADLRAMRWTLDRAAAAFGVTRRQVQYAAEKMLAVKTPWNPGLRIRPMPS